MIRQTRSRTKRQRENPNELMEASLPQKYSKIRTTSRKPTKQASKTKLNKLFALYQDENEEQIGPAGMERLCKDLQVAPEDVAMLVLAWKLKAERMCYFKRSEFINGLLELGVDSLEGLRNKLPELRKLLDDPQTLRSVFLYAFEFAKESNEKRTIDLDSAITLLNLLLPNNSHTPKLLSFLRQQTEYKSLNFDQWKLLLDFVQNVSSTFQEYSEDGAWPVLIDQYVESCRSNVVNAPLK